MGYHCFVRFVSMIEFGICLLYFIVAYAYTFKCTIMTFIIFLQILVILLSALFACQTVVSDTHCLVPDIKPIALEAK